LILQQSYQHPTTNIFDIFVLTKSATADVRLLEKRKEVIPSGNGGGLAETIMGFSCPRGCFSVYFVYTLIIPFLNYVYKHVRCLG
jgi:hypothetical protein